VVTWQHGDHVLDTGFRLTDETVQDRGVNEAHSAWVRAISKLAKRNAGSVEGDNV
jgi:hypothetical protein